MRGNASVSLEERNHKDEISKYFKTNVHILQLVGLWPCEQGTQFWKVICCRMFFVVGYTSHLFIFVSQILELIFHWHELEDPAHVSLTMITNFNSLIKAGCVIFYVKRFQHLVTRLEQTFYTASEPFKEEKKKIIDWTLYLTRTITLTIISACISTGASFSLIEHASNNVENNTYVRHLPFAAWYPFDKTKSPYYEMAYAGQSLNMFYNGVYLSTADTFIITMIIHTFHQFKILQLMLRNIKSDALNRIEARLRNTGRLKSSHCTISQNDGINSDAENVQSNKDLKVKNNLQDKQMKMEDNYFHINNDVNMSSILSFRQPVVNDIMSLISQKELDFELQDRLGEWIKTHQAFINFAAELEKMCSPFALVQLGFNMTYLVITGLYITLTPVKSAKFMASMIFMFADLTLMAVFSWCCGELAVESAGIYNAAYEAAWYEAPRKFKTAIGIIMIRTLRPNEITAGKFVALNLATFTSVMKASYSYLTVLQELYEDEKQE